MGGHPERASGPVPGSGASPMRRITAGLESETERIDQIRQFIEYASSLNDVWFVTNQQVCESRWSGAESGWWRQEQGADECPAAGSWSQL